MKNTILVTGANGFIGSALLPALIELGLEVKGSVRTKIQLSKLFKGVKGIAVGNIEEKTNWTEALDSVGTVIHLAGRAHIMDDHDELAHFRTNVEGTAHLAKQAVKNGVKKMIFVSTVKVMGEKSTQGNPWTEELSCHPQTPYAHSKLEAEIRLKEISRQTGLKLVILRLPLVYGPGVKANLLSLMNWIYRGWPLPLGQIKNSRSLISITNLVNILTHILHLEKLDGQTFLVSDGRDISTPELIEIIANMMGKKARLWSFPQTTCELVSKIIPPFKERIRRLTESLVVDSGKFRHITGWNPMQTVEEGIQSMVKAYLYLK